MKKVKRFFTGEKKTKASSLGKERLGTGNKNLSKKKALTAQKGTSKGKGKSATVFSVNFKQEVTKSLEDAEKTTDGDGEDVVEFVHFGDIRTKTSMLQLQKSDLKPINGYSRKTEMHDNGEKFLDKSSEEWRNYHQKGSLLVHQSQLDSVSTLYSTRRLQSFADKEMYPADPALNDKICLWYGDITRLKVDAIVNSVKWISSPREFLSGAIFNGAGHKLMAEEMHRIDETESCPVTSGFYLPAKYVLHGNVPNYMDAESAAKLKKTYLDCLQKIKELKIRTVVCVKQKKGLPMASCIPVSRMVIDIKCCTCGRPSCHIELVTVWNFVSDQ